MAKKTPKTPSFILHLPLRTTPADESVLYVRFDAARQVYNAVLGEALKRLRLMRESRDYQRARKLPKGKDRNALFKEVRERFGFSEYALHAYAKQFGHSWLGQHLDSLTIQKVTTRAFRATKEYAFGKRGKPRFKGKRGLQSVEGKNNTSGIRFSKGILRWLGLQMGVRIKQGDIVQEYGLMQRVKYCRILQKTIRGCVRWFVQLVLEGTPWSKLKNKPGEHIVGLDLGPSTIAIVDDQEARLIRFCDEVQDKSKDIRKLQRAMDRSRRANNPDNYNANGTIKKGRKAWRNSTRYKKLRARKAELERKLAAHRKSLHGKLANEVIRRGCTIRTEKVSYKSWQKNFGKSIGRRAPGMFIEILKRKAESAGGRMEDISTRKTALSQTCLCGARKKKKLSQRTHHCDKCGVVAQRDVFSAFLAKHVTNNKFDVDKALDEWRRGAEELLQSASKKQQIAKWKDSAPCRQSTPKLVGQSDSIAKEKMALTEISNVVALGLRSKKRESKKGRRAGKRWRQLDLPF